MYKCGWSGCEKAYGTLNHLNAHVTMQSHGQKRTPEGQSTINLMFVANARFWLACACSPFCGLHPLVVLHNMSLIIGVGTTLHIALRSPHSKSLGSAY